MPELTGTVTITGITQAGQILTANTDDLDGTGDITFQWTRGTVEIGANNSTYLVQADDVGYVITVTVSRSGYSGSVVSMPTGIVTPQPREDFTISFDQLENLVPNITVPTLYLIPGLERPFIAQLTVDKPDQYDSGSIKWYINGSQIFFGVHGSYGENIVIDSEVYSKIGMYYLTLELRKDGKFYSTIINFEVRP